MSSCQRKFAAALLEKSVGSSLQRSHTASSSSLVREYSNGLLRSSYVKTNQGMFVSHAFQ
jgi:hypothetical protein